MADQVFNIALGSVAAYYRNVDGNNPANSALVIVLLASTGIEADATLKDVDTLTALVAGTTNEATNTGYARKVLTDADLVAFAPDDTINRVDLNIPDQTWTSVANDGTGAISDLVVCYDGDTTAGTDANIEPLTMHDFSVTPSGGLGSTSFFLGQLAGLLGRHEEALRHLQDALEMHVQVGSRPWIAHAQCASAAVRLARGQAGDRERSGALLDQVLHTAEQLGMRRLQEKALALKERMHAGTAAGTDTTESRAAGTPQPVTAVFRPEGEYWVIAYQAPAFSSEGPHRPALRFDAARRSR